ncbi:hypothetical protein BT96DRAFT_951475 [Gymnopus androsaceus JB14]|uniref:Uncharacterized protein n=1 Tax=Gymnopus androsaceus JB14 TaxID=1447944 RepID=A0A6A4GCQ8_9AGAR|nr:hypothetical protein BT96DRAFT_951475 [Gymnopus androsaceus JB14]
MSRLLLLVLGVSALCLMHRRLLEFGNHCASRIHGLLSHGVGDGQGHSLPFVIMASCSQHLRNWWALSQLSPLCLPMQSRKVQMGCWPFWRRTPMKEPVVAGPIELT